MIAAPLTARQDGQRESMGTLNLCFPGELDYYDSYGLIACQLARHLTALGVHVNTMGLVGESSDTTPEDIAAIAQQPIRAMLGGIVLGYPTNYRHHNSLVNAGPRVALTMFESSKIPAGWVSPLNKCAAVITPSTFCRDVFRDCGVTVPIYVIPPGVNEVFRLPTQDTRPSRPYTFLALVDRGRRKGGLTALHAFVRAFGDDMDYRLILKAREKRELRVNILNPNVSVLNEDLDEAGLRDLYHGTDVLLSPSTGEGFGLIPREAASCGCVAMATNWSGLADDIDQWGLPLPYRLVPAKWDVKTLQGEDLGEWAEVDVDAMTELMRRVADNRDVYAQRARQAAVWVRAYYSWRTFAERVLNVWREVTN